MAPVDEDPRVDRLFEVGLSSFVAERNELAKRLRDEGAKDASTLVRSLTKPSVAAWVVNQLARRFPSEVAEIVDAGASLREAQMKALTGEDPSGVRAALTEERRLVNQLMNLVPAILSETGMAATPQRLDQVADTFTALASNEEAREQVRAGRLVHELQRVGFGDLEVPSDMLAALPQRTASERAADDREIATLEHKVERAVERAQRLRRDADGARRRAEEADRVALQAAEDAEGYRRELDERRQD